MTKRFRPYWAEISERGNQVSATVLRITTAEMEAEYLARDLSITRLPQHLCPVQRTGPLCVSLASELLAEERQRQSRVRSSRGDAGMRRIDISELPLLGRPRRWFNDSHYPELLPILYPGSFPKHRKGSRPRTAPAGALWAVATKVLRDAYGVDGSVGTRKPSKATRPAREFLELWLWVMEISGVTRDVIGRVSGLTPMQLSRLIAAGRAAHPYLGEPPRRIRRAHQKPAPGADRATGPRRRGAAIGRCEDCNARHISATGWWLYPTSEMVVLCTACSARRKACGAVIVRVHPTRDRITRECRPLVSPKALPDDRWDDAWFEAHRIDWRRFVRPMYSRGESAMGEGPAEPSVAGGGVVMGSAVPPLHLQELVDFLYSRETDPRDDAFNACDQVRSDRRKIAPHAPVRRPSCSCGSRDWVRGGRCWPCRAGDIEVKGGKRMTDTERIARLEQALVEIGKLGIRLAQMFPDSPLVLRTVDAFLADVLAEGVELAA